MNIFLLYFLFINIIGYLLVFSDKKRAIRKEWRISEATLFTISILGGSIGTLIAMYTFRHKTKHLKFTFGVPVIIIIQFCIYAYYLINK